VDNRLPNGGLARGHLHEAIEAGAASQYAGLATLFVAGILARMPGPVLWCLRGRDLFAPALARVGLHPDRVIFCETWKDRDVLPAMEEGLKCGGLAGVVGEVSRLSLNASRRLQLCAGESGVTALIIRRWSNLSESAGEPNAAATRWRIMKTVERVSGRTSGFGTLPGVDEAATLGLYTCQDPTLDGNARDSKVRYSSSTASSSCRNTNGPLWGGVIPPVN
jgi:protein ImuA